MEKLSFRIKLNMSSGKVNICISQVEDRLGSFISLIRYSAVELPIKLVDSGFTPLLSSAVFSFL